MKDGTCPETLQMTNDVPALSSKYACTWDQYCAKYNLLMEQIESKGISSALLNDVLNLKGELIKEKLILKMDDLIKV